MNQVRYKLFESRRIAKFEPIKFLSKGFRHFDKISSFYIKFHEILVTIRNWHWKKKDLIQITILRQNTLVAFYFMSQKTRMTYLRFPVPTISAEVSGWVYATWESCKYLFISIFLADKRNSNDFRLRLDSFLWTRCKVAHERQQLRHRAVIGRDVMPLRCETFLDWFCFRVFLRNEQLRTPCAI